MLKFIIPYFPLHFLSAIPFVIAILVILNSKRVSPLLWIVSLIFLNPFLFIICVLSDVTDRQISLITLSTHILTLFFAMFISDQNFDGK
jgi:hypothetical protein